MLKGISVFALGLSLFFPALSFAADGRYLCGLVPDTSTQIVLTVKGNQMRVQYLAGASAVKDGWYIVTESPHTVSTEVGVGTGTTHMLNLQRHLDQTILFMAENYYGEETTITPLGSQLCSSL